MFILVCVHMSVMITVIWSKLPGVSVIDIFLMPACGSCNSVYYYVSESLLR